MPSKKRPRKKSGISEREYFIGIIVVVVVLVIIQGISDFFSRYPWVGWTVGVVVFAIVVYAAIKLIRKYIN